uniref:Uncharacterized protein n=1 Tax=Solanum tuberosum TaxID=4113 RepID=M1DLT3_SOLTU
MAEQQLGLMVARDQSVPAAKEEATEVNHKKSLQLVMKTLKDYEQQSGQKINMEKSLFCVHDKTARVVIKDVENYIGFPRGNFL